MAFESTITPNYRRSNSKNFNVGSSRNVKVDSHVRLSHMTSRNGSFDFRGLTIPAIPAKHLMMFERSDDSNPEEGWDDETNPQADVIDYNTKGTVNRRVAFTSKMFNPTAAANNQWFFEKIFGDGDFMAAGQLVIPVKGRKPTKATKDNTYVRLTPLQLPRAKPSRRFSSWCRAR
jgi:hypothetical protein